MRLLGGQHEIFSEDEFVDKDPDLIIVLGSSRGRCRANVKDPPIYCFWPALEANVDGFDLVFVKEVTRLRSLQRRLGTMYVHYLPDPIFRLPKVDASSREDKFTVFLSGGALPEDIMTYIRILILELIRSTGYKCLLHSSEEIYKSLSLDEVILKSDGMICCLGEALEHVETHPMNQVETYTSENPEVPEETNAVNLKDESCGEEDIELEEQEAETHTDKVLKQDVRAISDTPLNPGYPNSITDIITSAFVICMEISHVDICTRARIPFLGIALGKEMEMKLKEIHYPFSVFMSSELSITKIPGTVNYFLSSREGIVEKLRALDSELSLIWKSGKLRALMNKRIKRIRPVTENIREISDVKDEWEMRWKLNSPYCSPGAKFNVSFMYQMNTEADIHSILYKELLHISTWNGIMCDIDVMRTFGLRRRFLKKEGILPYTSPWVGFVVTMKSGKDLDLEVDILRCRTFKQSLPSCMGLYVSNIDMIDQVRRTFPDLTMEFFRVPIPLHRSPLRRKIILQHVGSSSRFLSLKTTATKVIIDKCNLRDLNGVVIDFFGDLEVLIECVSRCIPLITSPYPTVMKYLGKNYPLYSDFSNIDGLLSVNVLKRTLEYMSEMNVETPDTFIGNIEEGRIYSHDG